MSASAVQPSNQLKNSQPPCVEWIETFKLKSNRMRLQLQEHWDRTLSQIYNCFPLYNHQPAIAEATHLLQNFHPSNSRRNVWIIMCVTTNFMQIVNIVRRLSTVMAMSSSDLLRPLTQKRQLHVWPNYEWKVFPARKWVWFNPLPQHFETCGCMCVSINACTYMHACLHVCAYTCILNACKHVSMWACMYVCTYACMRANRKLGRQALWRESQSKYRPLQ